MDNGSDIVKWIKVDKESDIKKEINDSKYYGAAIFNKDFSKNAMSKTQRVMIDIKKAEMKEKVASEEIPPAAIQQMKQKWGIKWNIIINIGLVC